MNMKKISYNEVSRFAISRLLSGTLVPPLSSASLCRYPACVECALHRINCFYFSLILEGEMEYCEQGAPPCLCRPGTLVLLPAFSNYSWRVLKPVTAFQCAHNGFSISGHGALSTLFGFPQRNVMAVELGREWATRAGEAAEHLTSGAFPGVRLSGFILEICAAALENGGNAGNSPVRDEDQELFKQCVYFVEEHLSKPFTAREMARKCRIGERKLFNLFHSRLNMAPFQYVAMRKVELAKRLLGTGMSGGEIAGHIGFAGQNYFIRFFKRQTGMTPEAFRRTLWKSAVTPPH